jgi:hypothetical protein
MTRFAGMLMDRAGRETRRLTAAKHIVVNRRYNDETVMLMGRFFGHFLDRAIFWERDIGRADTCILKRYLFSAGRWIICSSR